MKNRILLIIKGDKFVAASAATARGIPMIFERERIGGEETTGVVSSDFRAKVVSWFTEEPGQAPFPQGTLLFYSEN